MTAKTMRTGTHIAMRTGIERAGVVLALSLAWIAIPFSAASETIPLPSRTLLPGLEWVQWDGGASCRSGDSAIPVLIADPERVRFRVFHYRQEGDPHPPGIGEWVDRTGASALFNAGQYYPDYSYMGLLILDGRPVRTRLHPLFRALFVAEPLGASGPKARVLDLTLDPFESTSPGYLQVAQSFMLLDRSGEIRVQKTANVANRTVVAEGTDGRIFVFVTRGGYTLWELGELLRSGPFPLRQAMSMDGGEESQLVVRVPGFQYDGGETAVPGESAERPVPRWRRPLPTVIGIFPRSIP